MTISSKLKAKKHREMQLCIALYFRFVRMHSVFGLEVRHAKRGKSAKIADFACSNGQDIIEVEVKTNRDDLVRDFRRKKGTHDMYRGSKAGTPNYFYFAVPPDLGDVAIDLVYNVNPSYGIMVVDLEGVGVVKEAIKVIKYPQRLSDKMSKEYYNSILLRQSSELANYMIADANTFTFGVVDGE